MQRVKATGSSTCVACNGSGDMVFVDPFTNQIAHLLCPFCLGVGSLTDFVMKTDVEMIAEILMGKNK